MFDDPLIAFAVSRLPEYLMRQRWYPAKDAGAPQVSLESLLPFPAGELSAVVAVWNVEPPGRPPLQLFVPLAHLAAGAADALPETSIVGRPPRADGVLIEAFASDVFVRAFMAVLSGGTAPAGLIAERTAQFDHRAASQAAAAAIRRSSVEQSNTSIRIGDGAMLKVIRKLEKGSHPELEMGRFLTTRAHFEGTPALLAWMDVASRTVAILQAFVPNEGDGWSWIEQRLREGEPGRSAALAWIGGLGEATAEMHLALALQTGDPAFDPEPATAADWQRWSGATSAMAQRAQRSLQEGAARAGDGALDPTARALAQALQGHDPQQAMARLLPHTPLSKTRHHGDFHLGQVLVCGGRAIIVDFEGEPLRPLAERRAKHCPLRDVAGMLRSFDYAAAVCAREHAVAGLEEWRRAAAGAFIDSYLARGAQGPGCPDERDEALHVIEFFTIEKALYEVLYELANRPAWVSIPLRSVVDLMAHARAPQSAARELPHGAELREGGGVRFRLWAPGCATVKVEVYANGSAGDARTFELHAGPEGWHERLVEDLHAGDRYRFVLPDGMRVPDPASRFQPEDVHGPSEVIDPNAYRWQQPDWAGRPWHEAVIYELHVGTFTDEGTFRAAIERLDHLQSLGITAIEIMPIADFPGGRNWGYDGALLYAPDASYGRPEDLKAFIDAAHARRMMVLLDVVYNHFGPDGNYLPVFAPPFFTDRHKTPWGAAVNFDGPHSAPVREFIIHNALYWLREYRFDGLRLDAVHAILDDGERHLLDELAERAREVHPHVHLVLENEENQARRLKRAAHGGAPLHYTAQWNDDVHHVLHVAATGETNGYYAEYAGDADKLGRALAEGFAFQGQVMEFRGSARGEPSALLPPAAFVAFIQNHDQIGNRAFGERITAIAPVAAVRAIAAIYLLLPQTPMLFMGEEWGASTPFPFFCDFDGELAEAVRTGRRMEFAKFPEFQDEAMRARIPDPQAPATFASGKLRWNELERPEHAEWFALYRRLLGQRREAILPLLPMGPHAGSYQAIGPAAVQVSWQGGNGAELTLAANLSAQPVAGFPAGTGSTLWQEGEAIADGTAPAWSVRWSVAAPHSS